MADLSDCSINTLTDMARVLVYEHPLDGSTVLPVLKPLLPNPLPLYRRIQFPLRNPSSYLLATFKPGAEVKDIQSCFCAALVERSVRPETEVRLFLSGEVNGQCPRSSSEGTATHRSDEPGQHCADCSAAILSVVSYISSLPLPSSIHANDQAVSLPIAVSPNGAHESTTADYSRHLIDPNLVLFGNVAALPVSILKTNNLVRTELPGLDFDYQKFIIHTGSLRSRTSDELPPGLRWGEVRSQDFALVKSRTAIPRKDKTLATVPSVAIFPSEPDSAPIAWCFLGVDGSLMTLHVEPEHRGRGLAKAATFKLWTEKFGAFDEEEGKRPEGWLAHSDVHVANKESAGVARSLGGVEGWMSWWVRVDLSRL